MSFNERIIFILIVLALIVVNLFVIRFIFNPKHAARLTAFNDFLQDVHPMPWTVIIPVIFLKLLSIFMLSALISALLYLVFLPERWVLLVFLVITLLITSYAEKKILMQPIEPADEEYAKNTESMKATIGLFFKPKTIFIIMLLTIGASVILGLILILIVLLTTS